MKHHVKLRLDMELQHSLVRLLYEITDAMMVTRLKDSLEDWAAMKHPEDRKYSKEYNKAVKIVVNHFSLERDKI